MNPINSYADFAIEVAMKAINERNIFLSGTTICVDSQAAIKALKQCLEINNDLLYRCRKEIMKA